ncbi:MAG: hypothetical protein ACJ79K_03890 [Gemmatimonadaceae bacterium]
MRQQSRCRYPFTALLALLVLGAAGCVQGGLPGGKGFAPDSELDTVEVEAERDTQPPITLERNRSQDVVIARAPTRALTHPIDSLSDADLVKYLNSLHWKPSWSHFSTQRANAPCTHRTTGVPCASGDSADLLIQPEAGTSKWEHDSIPPNGIIVARVINRAADDRDADSLGFRAGAKTWWVVDDSAGTLRSRFFVRTYVQNAPITFVTRTRPFIRCGHQDAPSGRPARGKFWNCAQSSADTLLAAASAGNRAGRTAAVDGPFHLASFESRVPMPIVPRPLAMLTAAWVTCSMGCCSTGP